MSAARASTPAACRTSCSRKPGSPPSPAPASAASARAICASPTPPACRRSRKRSSASAAVSPSARCPAAPRRRTRALSVLIESEPGSSFLFEHDLFRKPASTFRDHALARLGRRAARRRFRGGDRLHRLRLGAAARPRMAATSSQVLLTSLQRLPGQAAQAAELPAGLLAHRHPLAGAARPVEKALANAVEGLQDVAGFDEGFLD